MRRRAIYLMALLGVPVAMLVLSVGTAVAAGPTSVTVTGPGLSEPLTLDATGDPELFTDLLNEVTWLATRSPNAPAPDANKDDVRKLGPKYTVAVAVDGKPDQTYDLYPYAAGGPRVFRPAEQPHKRKTAAGWFYGRLSMPDTLRAAGVPLASPDTLEPAGGRGGGELVPPRAVTSSSSPYSIDEMLAQWQRSVLLAGAVAVVMVIGLAGVALLVRRY